LAKAEAFTNATIILEDAGAISHETALQRSAQFNACMKASEDYRKALKEDDPNVGFEREVMIQTCPR
jgi:hypothetical protein